jgi:stage II sporulation protein GA (sporulation sigma-E factor processing peptidase)
MKNVFSVGSDAEIYVFYADVFWVQNCLMNAGILLMQSEIMPVRKTRSRSAFARILAASGIGGILQLLFLCVVKRYAGYLAVSMLLVIPGMTVGVFGAEPVPVFIRRILLGYVTAGLLGGCAAAMENLFRFGSSQVWVLFASLFAGRKSLGLLRRQMKKQEQLCEVLLRHRGHEVCCTALLDTGNQLSDPITRRPVHVISPEIFRKLELSAEDYVGLAGYCSLGEEAGILPLYEVDALFIKEGAQAQMSCMEKSVVACTGTDILAQKPYQVILNVEGVVAG